MVMMRMMKTVVTAIITIIIIITIVTSSSSSSLVPKTKCSVAICAGYRSPFSSVLVDESKKADFSWHFSLRALAARCFYV